MAATLMEVVQTGEMSVGYPGLGRFKKWAHFLHRKHPGTKTSRDKEMPGREK